jgi:hypothetical protein
MKLACAAFMFVAFVARSTRAAEPEGPRETSTSNASADGRHWYGWQTLGTDGATLVSIAIFGGLGSVAHSDVLTGIGGATASVGYLLGSPAVHAGHGQWALAAGSLGLRVGAPIAGAVGGYLVGQLACPKHDDGDIPCPVATAEVGAISGLLTAVIVDAAVLAYEPTRPMATVRWTPNVSIGGNDFRVGIAGSF